MSRRRKILMSLLFLLSVGAVWVFWPSDDLEYKGKKLSHWTRQATSFNSTEEREATEALLAIGTNGIPFYLEWLEYRTPYPKALCLHLANEVVGSLNSKWFIPNKRAQLAFSSRYALEKLGTNAAPAVPMLVKLLSSPNARERAALVLRSLKVHEPLLAAVTNQNPGVQKEILPLLHRRSGEDIVTHDIVKQLLRSPDRAVRYEAISAISNLDWDKTSLHEMREKALQDPDPFNRAHVLNLMCKSKDSEPLLRKALKDPDQIVRTTAQEIIVDLKSK